MDFLRSNILRRGATNEHDVENPSAAAQPEMAERPRPTARRFPLSRPLFPSRTHQPPPVPNQGSSQLGDDGEVESPKTPRFTLGMPNLPSTRLHLPHLARTWTNGSNGPASRPGTARPGTSRTGGASEPMPRPSFQRNFQDRLRALATSTPTPPTPTPPEPVARPEGEQHERNDRLRRFDGTDPAELHLAALADDGRRRRRRRETRDAEGRNRPRRFLFCFPWVRSRRIRSQILRCFVSGLFLTLLLTVYLALSITKNINNSEFTVLLILIILFTTIFFCHGLIRLCMMVVRPRRHGDDEGRRNRLPQFIVPGGYAVPREPIRVVLARDEEAAGIDSEATKLKPPAYGLWRESVRVDPNRLFWQRNEDAQPEVGDSSAAESSSSSRTGTTAPRPPSYASEDGVTYVINAQPRSIAPATEVPLPLHPSEIGRVSSQRAAW